MGAASKWCALMIEEASIAFGLYHWALAVGAQVVRNDPDNGCEYIKFYLHIGPVRVELTF